MRLRPWQYAIILVALCAGALWWTRYTRSQAYADSGWLFKRLPADHAVVAGLDVSALRRAGLLDILAGNPADEDAEYRRFIREIAFNYRTDLDYVAASLAVDNGPRNFLLTGRFDWEKLTRASIRAGGRCQNAFCDLPGFAQGRNLSFLPVSPTSIGVTISPAPEAAWALAADNAGLVVPSVPVYPAFVSMEASLLAQSGWMPPLFEPAAQVLSSADWVVVGLAANGSSIDLVLDATCMSPERAELVRQGMQRVLGSGAGLGAVLAAGSLTLNGKELHGRWPIERSALQTLLP